MKNEKVQSWWTCEKLSTRKTQLDAVGNPLCNRFTASCVSPLKAVHMVLRPLCSDKSNLPRNHISFFSHYLCVSYFLSLFYSFFLGYTKPSVFTPPPPLPIPAHLSFFKSQTRLKFHEQWHPEKAPHNEMYKPWSPLKETTQTTSIIQGGLNEIQDDGEIFATDISLSLERSALRQFGFYIVHSPLLFNARERRGMNGKGDEPHPWPLTLPWPITADEALRSAVIFFMIIIFIYIESVRGNRVIK